MPVSVPMPIPPEQQNNVLTSQGSYIFSSQITLLQVFFSKATSLKNPLENLSKKQKINAIITPAITQNLLDLDALHKRCETLRQSSIYEYFPYLVDGPYQAIENLKKEVETIFKTQLTSKEQLYNLDKQIQQLTSDVQRTENTYLDIIAQETAQQYMRLNNQPPIVYYKQYQDARDNSDMQAPFGASQLVYNLPPVDTRLPAQSETYEPNRQTPRRG